jgi:exodeoxyribonuclease V alpha subunit
MSEKEKVEGYVEHIIFRNEENGYTVLNLSMKGRELTCVGTLPMIGEGADRGFRRLY